MLADLISLVITFLKDNYVKIIIATTIILVFYLIFFLTTTSLKKLKTEIFSSYPFDLFFPQGGTWSVGYFLIALTGLGLLIYLMLQGKFIAGPA